MDNNQNMETNNMINMF